MLSNKDIQCSLRTHKKKSSILLLVYGKTDLNYKISIRDSLQPYAEGVISMRHDLGIEIVGISYYTRQNNEHRIIKQIPLVLLTEAGLSNK